MIGDKEYSDIDALIKGAFVFVVYGGWSIAGVIAPLYFGKLWGVGAVPVALFVWVVVLYAIRAVTIYLLK